MLLRSVRKELHKPRLARMCLSWCHLSPPWSGRGSHNSCLLCDNCIIIAFHLQHIPNTDALARLHLWFMLRNFTTFYQILSTLRILKESVNNRRLRKYFIIPPWHGDWEHLDKLFHHIDIMWRCFKCYLFQLYLSLIHIWRCRRYSLCRSRWSPYH